MRLSEAIATLKDYLERDLNLFIDAGNTGAFALHHLPVSGKNICFVSLAMGGMGNSIGVALGACFQSGQRSCVIIGDGAILMNGLEIHTVVEHQLPVQFIILNNNAHGMCETREQVFFNTETGLNSFRSSYFASGFRSMFPELFAEEIFTKTDLVSALQRTQNISGPSVLCIHVDNDDLPPFVTFQKEKDQ